MFVVTWTLIVLSLNMKLRLGIWMSDPYLYYNSIKDTPVCGHLDFIVLREKIEVNHDILSFILAPGYIISLSKVCWRCVVLTIYEECRTKQPGTKHPMPFFATPDKTSRINLPPRTKHPMQFLSPRTKHPMPFLPPRTKHPMLFLPPRTKHPTLCLKPMIVHKTSHLVNCHYY